MKEIEKRLGIVVNAAAETKPKWSLAECVEESAGLEVKQEKSPPPFPRKEMIAGREVTIHLWERDEVKLQRALTEFAEECGRQKFKKTDWEKIKWQSD